MNVVVHIGFHKAATKTLQTMVFPTIWDCAVLSPGTDHFDYFYPMAVDFCEAADGAVPFDELRVFLDVYRGRRSTLVVSFEDFTVRDHEGRTATRLKELLPDARVVVCVREQGSMLYSAYGQYLRDGGTLSLGAYAGVTSQVWLRYGELVQRYQQAFGSEQVLALPYELLVEDRTKFLVPLREFVAPGAPRFAVEPELPVVNRGMARPTRWVRLRANRLLHVDLHNPLPRFEREGRAQAIGSTMERLENIFTSNRPPTPGRRARAILDRVAQRYAESNVLLARLTGLPLQELGYVVAA